MKILFRTIFVLVLLAVPLRALARPGHPAPAGVHPAKLHVLKTKKFWLAAAAAVAGGVVASHQSSSPAPRTVTPPGRGRP